MATMQTMYALVGERTLQRDMPPSEAKLRCGIEWGRFDELFTAAYWCGQAWQASVLGRYQDVRLGRSLPEEMAACLLGGYGIPAEMGLAAYARLRDRGLLQPGVSEAEYETNLAEQIDLNGKFVRYRFPRQKARYLARCMTQIGEIDEDALDDVELRETLTALPGIGRKTASWIVRNRRNSDSVAVLDVHILRAGRLMGLYGKEENPQRDYLSLEARFVDLASEFDIPAFLLDAVMWQHMRLLRNV